MICSKCAKDKPVEAFTPRKGRPKKPYSSQCKECSMQQARKFREEKWGHFLNTRLKREYKFNGRPMEITDYFILVHQQGGMCATCDYRQPKDMKGRLVVDHDHATGEVRGLLCPACNTGLGYFKDNPHALRAAANYLERGK